jgi:hypothetical protein
MKRVLNAEGPFYAETSCPDIGKGKILLKGYEIQKMCKERWCYKHHILQAVLAF